MIRYLVAGAANVQIASLIYMRGYDVVRSMLESIEGYLDGTGAGSICELIGEASGKLQPLEAVDRSSRYHARVTDACTSCGRCREICLYDAIDFSGQRPVIRSELCDGCGLCAEICDRGIVMEEAAPPAPKPRGAGS